MLDSVYLWVKRLPDSKVGGTQNLKQANNKIQIEREKEICVIFHHVQSIFCELQNLNNVDVPKGTL